MLTGAPARGPARRRKVNLSLLLVVVVLANSPAAAQVKVYLAPDVPTQIPLTATFMLPWQSTAYLSGSYTVDLDFPDPDLTPPGTNPAPEIDALHRLSTPGHWLFSLKTGLSAIDANPDPLATLLGASVSPSDIIRYEGGNNFSLFFCSTMVSGAVPSSSNLDAMYMEDGDDGDLIVSFDAHTTLNALYEPADLVRFTRTGTTCSSWSIAPIQAGVQPAFDATGHITSNYNVVGAAQVPGQGIVLALDGMDVPLTGASGTTTYDRGELVLWDGANFSPYATLGGWPSNARLNALSLPFTPTCPGFDMSGGSPSDGLVETCMVIGKKGNGEELPRLEWLTETGALAYNIYRTSWSGGASFPLTCLTASTPGGITDLQYLDEDPVGAGEGRFYLVTAELAGGEGALGNTRHVGGGETPRVNSSPCP